MDREAILAVADVVEFFDRLDMSNWASDGGPRNWSNQGEIVTKVWEDCGTTACIAGWTCAWADIKPKNAGRFFGLARKELDLNEAQAERLFIDRNWWKDQGYTFSSLTGVQAAHVMRQIAWGQIDL